MERLKEIIKAYGAWGVFLSAVTIVIRPFISIRQSLRDAAITFLFSMLSGLTFEYLDVADPVRYGLSGVCGLFAVRIFMIAEAVLKQVEKDPANFIRHWRKYDDRGE